MNGSGLGLPGWHGQMPHGGTAEVRTLSSLNARLHLLLRADDPTANRPAIKTRAGIPFTTKLLRENLNPGLTHPGVLGETGCETISDMHII
jgi:hypothetical protein